MRIASSESKTLSDINWPLFAVCIVCKWAPKREESNARMNSTCTKESDSPRLERIAEGFLVEWKRNCNMQLCAFTVQRAHFDAHLCVMSTLWARPWRSHARQSPNCLDHRPVLIGSLSRLCNRVLPTKAIGLLSTSDHVKARVEFALQWRVLSKRSWRAALFRVASPSQEFSRYCALFCFVGCLQPTCLLVSHFNAQFRNCSHFHSRSSLKNLALHA
eukprot:2647572-Amphidinium_carterae.1